MSTTVIDDTLLARARSTMTASRCHAHAVLQIVADLDAQQVASTTGYRSTIRLLQDLWNISDTEATRLRRHAHLLVESVSLSGETVAPVLPETAAAHADGKLHSAQVDIIDRAITVIGAIPGIDAPTVAAAEALLAEHATRLGPRGLSAAARRLVDTLDPDGAAPDEPGEPVDELHYTRRRRDGKLSMAAEFHGAGAEITVEVLDALAGPAGPDDRRTLAQRRAAALLELITQAMSATGIATDSHHEHQHGDDDPTDRDTDDNPSDGQPSDGQPSDDPAQSEPADDDPAGFDPADDEPVDGDEPADNQPADDYPGDAPDPEPAGHPGDRASGRASGRGARVMGRPVLALTIDHRWLQNQLGHATLDSGHTLSPATARRLACDAGIVPIILGTRSEPLDVGRLSYTIPDGMRRALHQRDRGCSFPGCTRRPRRCAAHHVRHWLDHGETKIVNLTLLCVYHHHLIHHDHWHITMINGRPWYTPPPWIDPDQTPRPGGPHPLPA